MSVLLRGFSVVAALFFGVVLSQQLYINVSPFAGVASAVILLDIYLALDLVVRHRV